MLLIKITRLKTDCPQFTSILNPHKQKSFQSNTTFSDSGTTQSSSSPLKPERTLQINEIQPYNNKFASQRSKEQIQQILLLIDILEIIMPLHQLLNILLHILLSPTLNRYQQLTLLLPKPLTILHRYYIRLLEAFCQEIIENSRSVRKMDVIVIFYPLGDGSDLTGLIELG
jgi:hypothetical protein